MTNIEIDIRGLDRAIEKLKKFPGALQSVWKDRMEMSLLELWSAVRPYPPKPPTSKYKRTGTLGRSIGSGMAGGKADKPTVYSIKGSGTDMQGHFGTNLSYAKYVIDPERQAYMHQGRWWTMESIKKDAMPKIKKHWYDMVKMVLKKL